MDFCIISSEKRRTCHWPEGNPFDKKGWEWWGQVAWQGPASRELRGTARSQGWALTWGDLAMQGWRSGLKMVIKVSHSPVSSQQVHSNEANVRRRWGGQSVWQAYGQGSTRVGTDTSTMAGPPAWRQLSKEGEGNPCAEAFLHVPQHVSAQHIISHPALGACRQNPCKGEESAWGPAVPLKVRMALCTQFEPCMTYSRDGMLMFCGAGSFLLWRLCVTDNPRDYFQQVNLKQFINQLQANNQR